MIIILKIIIALLFPPIAAFWQVGFGLHFWLNLLLTLLFYGPGMVHALWLVATDK